MNRIAQPEDISDIKISDLKQTGNFNHHNQQPFKASVSPLRSRTPIRSSSSSSEEFKYRKKKPIKQQSPKSHISNKSPSLISRFKVTQQSSEVFCVTCEQFIGADVVNRHRCQSKDESIDMKLAKIYELLLLRKVTDQNLKTLIQIIAACTMEIYESIDSYTLQRCLEDICVLKSQVQQCQDEQTYNILILTGKVHQYLLAKMESIRQPVVLPDNQTQISYTNTNTNFTIRKRLFSEQKSIIPKQLINKNFKPEIQTQPKLTQENEKPGIQYGNKFDSAKKYPFIELTAQIQVQPSEPPSEKKAPKSIISQISGFLSQISLNNNQGNERQKKPSLISLQGRSRSCKLNIQRSLFRSMIFTNNVKDNRSQKIIGRNGQIMFLKQRDFFFVYLIYKKMLEEQEIYALVQKTTYGQNEANIILSKLDQGIEQKFCPHWAHIVDKLLRVLTSDQKTKVLALVQKRIASFREVSELTIVVMQNCIQTSNYKLAAKIVNSPTVKFTHHQLQESYFYLSGIISQGLRQFQEALRYYTLATQIGFQSHFYVDALKQKSLLDFRLANDRPDRKGAETIISSLWSFLLNEGAEPGLTINPLIDEDAKCALRECPHYAFIRTMMNHQSTMTRIPFSMTPFKNTRQLLAVNERIDAFWIHEQGQYIVFKDKISYESLNDQLRRRYDLVIQL